jgi:hypothetical protein
MRHQRQRGPYTVARDHGLQIGVRAPWQLPQLLQQPLQTVGIRA